MNQKNVKAYFFNELNKLLKAIIRFCKRYGQSEILQIYSFNILSSFAYANLVSNFFKNLTKENVANNNLPSGKIGIIKKHYNETLKKVHKSINKGFNSTENLDRDYYQWFKTDLRQNFPEFAVVLFEIERSIDTTNLETFLEMSRKKISKSFKDKVDLHTEVDTALMEKYVENNWFPVSKKQQKLVKKVMRRSLNEATLMGVKLLEQSKKKTLEGLHTDTIGFQSRLYTRWKEPLDLLELLINSSIEIGEHFRTHLNGKKNIKHPVLIKIHARSIQVASEIFALLKSGYADGANGRWRTLYELTGIFLILQKNPDFLSEKYLEHRIVRANKEVEDLERHYSELGYRSIPIVRFQKIKNEYLNLKSKYGIDIKNDYGWIPKSILKDSNFKALTKVVGIDHYLPYYNMSLNASHGGAAGFYRFGLTHNTQDKILLAGASEYGLADPIQNTSYCLKLMDVVLLSLNSSYENMIQIELLNKFFGKIGEIAVNVHKNLEQTG